MEEPHKKGLATRLDLKSCAGGREVAGEALIVPHQILIALFPKLTL